MPLIQDQQVVQALGSNGFCPSLRDGSQPIGVTMTTLTRAQDLPLLWEEQEALIAFSQ
jgi:hypothetical protein